MKNLFKSSLLMLLALMFVGCSDDEGIPLPVRIPTEVDNVEIPFASIEGVEIPGPINVPLGVDFEQLVSEEVNIPGFTLDNIATARLREFKMELNDSDFVGDLSAIKDVDLYLKAENPDVEEIKIAEVRNNTNTEVINFDVVEEGDIVDYFKSEETIVVLRNIVGGESSLTTFTVKLTPVWRFSFQL